MRFTVAASALFAGMAVAAPAVTLTAYSTDVDTIISCASDITNCPARSHSSTAVPVSSSSSSPVAAVPTSSTSAAVVSSVPTAAASSSSPVAAASTSVGSAPIVSSSPVAAASTSVGTAPVISSAPVMSSSTTVGQSTIYLYSTDTMTITSCAATVTNCPARTSLTSSIVGSTVVPVASGSASSSVVAPYPISGNGTTPAGPTASAPSASGSGSAYPTYTGAASHLNAGMALAGVGAFAALLL